MNSILFIYTSKKHKVDINRFSEIKKYGKLSICFPKDLRQKFSFYYDKNIYIGLSGLIYNQEELLKEYDKKDIFSLALSLYEKSEKDFFVFLNKLRGQQAFIIYDIKKDKILIINDKFGLYSCYFYEKDDVFIYSNCANTLLSNINFENNLNYDAISDYLSLGIVQNRETFARDVNNMSEGSILVKEKNKRVRFKKYYNIVFDDSNYDREAYLEKINNTFKRVVLSLYNYSSLPKASCLTAGFDTRLMNSILLDNGIKQLAVFTRFPIREESEINKFAIPMDEKIGREFAAKFGIEYALLGKGGDNHEIEQNKFVLMNGLFGGELFGAESYNQPATLFRVKIPSTGKTHFLTNRFKNLLTRDSIEFYYKNISKINTKEWDKKVFIHKAVLLATSFFNNLEDYGGQDWQHPNKLFRESSFLNADKIFYPYTDSSFLELMFKIPFKELDGHVFYKALLEKYYSKYLSVDILHCKKRHYKYDKIKKRLYVHKKIEEEMLKKKYGSIENEEKRKEKAIKDFLYYLKSPVDLDNFEKGFFFYKNVGINEKDILYHRIEEMQKWFFRLKKY